MTHIPLQWNDAQQAQHAQRGQHGETVEMRAVTTKGLTGDPDFDELMQECIKILVVKGNDYTIGANDADRLHNFKTVAKFTGVTPETVLGVYLYKHVSAVFAFIKSGGKSASEPIGGRLADVINYCLLFYKMVKERERGNL